MAMETPQDSLPHDQKPPPRDTPGPIERGVLGAVLAGGMVVTASVAMAEGLSLPERIVGVSFALVWIALAGMTVKVWGEPQLRGLYFANPIGSKLARMKRFLARYRERFGPDLWSTLFIWSSAATFLSALFLAAIKT